MAKVSMYTEEEKHERKLAANRKYREKLLREKRDAGWIPSQKKYNTDEERRIAKNLAYNKWRRTDKGQAAYFKRTKSTLEGYYKNKLKDLRNRAKKKNLPFNITYIDLLEAHVDICPYLDIEMTRFGPVGGRSACLSVDRIEPHLGYVKGNIQIISHKANEIKNNSTIAELITFAKRVLELHGDK